MSNHLERQNSALQTSSNSLWYLRHTSPSARRSRQWCNIESNILKKHNALWGLKLSEVASISCQIYLRTYSCLGIAWTPEERTQSLVKSCDKPMIFRVNLSARVRADTRRQLSGDTWKERRRYWNWESWRKLLGSADCVWVGGCRVGAIDLHKG